MSTILVKNGTIVTMNKNRDQFIGDLLIEGNKIKEIAKVINAECDQVIDATNRVVIPGLIQAHIHLTQTLFRGQGDDMELMPWLRERIWPLEGSHTAESNYVSAKLGIAELIMGGTTSIIDMATVNHTEKIMEAIDETGFRAVVGKCMMDFGNADERLMEETRSSIDESVRLLEKWHGAADGRITYAFAPRFVVSCSEELLLEVKDLAKKYDVMIHTHASENQGECEIVESMHGMRNLEYLHHIGLTGEKLVLAHCIWIDDNEMKIIADTGTKVVHCPSSNLKLASGIAKIPELLEMGANVSIGADGAPCTNNLDMFTEMRSASLIQKARLLSPTIMPAHTVFELATIGGAKAMCKENELGSLEVGKLADVVIVDTNNIHSSPTRDVDVIANLVYNTRASNVQTTIIDGKIVMLDRKLLTIDEEELKADANNLIAEQIKVSGISK
ncbi:5'-deoxyadenosine deaminase [Mycoplasmatota bacterium]|nr:5'-deoxyadenosine deaminase [Mycoplasmatota bacterium]